MRRRIGWLLELQCHWSGAAGECTLSCRGEGDTVVAAQERWKEWGEEKKGRKKKKRRGRWGAGQLGPTSVVLTCGTV